VKAALAVAATLLAGCESVLEVTLVAAPGEDIGLDASCVNLVYVGVQGNSPDDFQELCLSVEPGTVESLRDHGLEGILDVPMPESGLRYLRVEGVVSQFADCAVADPIFHGAAEYSGGDSLPIFLRMSLDCAKQVVTPATVKVIDQVTLVNTGTCSTTDETWMASAGLIVPTDLDIPSLLNTVYYQPFATTTENAIASGAAPVSLQYSATEGSSCLALGVIRPDRQAGNISCIVPGPRTACAGAGEVELAQADFDNMMALLDTSPALRNTTLVTVWDADMDLPITGATVAVDDPGATVEFVTLTGSTFTKTGGTSTGASGSFLLHAGEPALVSITAPGFRDRTVRIGSVIVGGAIVVLSR
jgi:hypothetical protein